MASILIVDDDKAVSLIMKLLLERDGHCITCAGDGPTALQVFRQEEFKLLIVDIFMPGMDGLETMRQAHQLRPGVPIIVISGHAFSSRSTSSPDFLGMSIKLGAVCSPAETVQIRCPALAGRAMPRA
ncbi:response regulator [Tardiphaga sp.]|uniref:response regulator n=1 Tax=Tardiphaga sp. TaxID=1926292 RepID=UPI00261EA6A7|nr:response regulator [Tardiphaga sp.]